MRQLKSFPMTIRYFYKCIFHFLMSCLAKYFPYCLYMLYFLTTSSWRLRVLYSFAVSILLFDYRRISSICMSVLLEKLLNYYVSPSSYLVNLSSLSCSYPLTFAQYSCLTYLKPSIIKRILSFLSIVSANFIALFYFFILFCHLFK